jgi:hypothetical protein
MGVVRRVQSEVNLLLNVLGARYQLISSVRDDR